MESQAMFLNCPAYLGNAAAARCGLPAEVEVRYIGRSTDGPLESAKIRCPLGHWFNGPIEYLTVPQPLAAAAVSASPLPSRPFESADLERAAAGLACGGSRASGHQTPPWC
jgi:hypothetical protein